MVCRDCEGKGWIIDITDNREVARRCHCQEEISEKRTINLPEKMLDWFVSNFSTLENDSLKKARNMVMAYIEAYPAVDHGLLFYGPSGTGKSHLAVAALKEIASRSGIIGQYVDFNDLLFKIQRTIGSDGHGSLDAIIEPFIKTRLLLIDDFASTQGNAWVWDIVYHIINQRYLHKRHLMLTTRYSPDIPAEERSDYQSKNRFLVDRVGQQLASRLLEMCRSVPLSGEDFRQQVRQHELG